MKSMITAAGLIDQPPRGLWRPPLSDAQVSMAVKFGTDIWGRQFDQNPFSVELYDDKATDMFSPEYRSRKPIGAFTIVTAFSGIARHCASKVHEGRSPDMEIVKEVAASGIDNRDLLFQVETNMPHTGVLRVVPALDWNAQMRRMGATPFLNPGMAKAGYLFAEGGYETKAVHDQPTEGRAHMILFEAPWPKDQCEEIYAFWATKIGWLSGLYSWAKLSFGDYH